MIAELGQLLLALAAFLALLGSLPERARAWALPGVGWTRLALLQGLAVSGAMLALIAVFVDSDFSVALVAEHSHSHKPLIFKIAGAWAQHEGSMLLWALVLVVYGAGWALCQRQNPLTPDTLRVQSMLLLGTLVFILCTSNPFLRLPMPPAEGNGLNPLLQDIGLALHPPMLYLGYVGLSLIFSLAVAAMRRNTLDAEWARQARPWLMVPWAVLTIGIGLGSWWAYRELGWGGWWFWDPVENASFVPWLVATALLHSLVVLERRNAFQAWVALLATLGFGCSLMGTFLVRSGILTSVHSFASDPARGAYILIFITLMLGYAMWEYGRFAVQRRPEALAQGIGRGHALLLNNLLLIVMAATVLTGTVYPVILPLFSDQQISVGAPYFEATIYPLGGLLLLLGGSAMWLGWEATPLRRLRRFAGNQLLLLIALGLILATWLPPMPPASWLGVAMGLWVLVGSFAGLRGGKLTARRMGMVMAHAGLGLFVLSAALNHALKEEHTAALKVGESVAMGPHRVTLMGLGGYAGKDYDAKRASLRITTRHGELIPLLAEERNFHTEAQQTNEAAIATRPFADWYAVAQFRPEGVQLKLMVEPAILGVWLGVALMALGGLWSCFGGLRRRPNLSHG